MKARSALQQSIMAVQVLLAFVLFFSVLYYLFPSRYTMVPLILASLFLVGDAINIAVIRRRASRDPGYLDRKVS